jgi:hypothetical protein
MGFRLSGSPFSRIFPFFTMEFRLSRSLSHELFLFFTMEFWLSRSLSHELFSFFTMEFRLSRSLCHELFLFFSRWNFGYHEAFVTNSFFFHDGISRHKIRNMQFGGRLFSYIYRKEYLHGIRLVKNLASWFRAPFARKRVRSFLF